jgi:hypothetical protein
MDLEACLPVLPLSFLHETKCCHDDH